jgi:site-specific DNA recombinase
MNSTALRAALYTRMSSDETTGLGLEVQERRLREYAAQRGYIVAGLYTDEGVSGFKVPEQRPEAAALLQGVAEGFFDVVLVVRLDRWSRNTVAGLMSLQAFAKAGIGFEASDERIDASAMGKLQTTMMLGQAQYYRDFVAERTRAAMQLLKEKGVRLGAPALETSDEGRETAQRISQLHASGASLSAIARTLTAEGRRTARGGAWHPFTVSKVLGRAA